MPLQENVVMFETFNAKNYSDSPKYIYEYLVNSIEYVEDITDKWCNYYGKKYEKIDCYNWHSGWLFPANKLHTAKGQPSQYGNFPYHFRKLCCSFCRIRQGIS